MKTQATSCDLCHVTTYYADKGANKRKQGFPLYLVCQHCFDWSISRKYRPYARVLHGTIEKPPTSGKSFSTNWKSHYKIHGARPQQSGKMEESAVEKVLDSVPNIVQENIVNPLSHAVQRVRSSLETVAVPIVSSVSEDHASRQSETEKSQNMFSAKDMATRVNNMLRENVTPENENKQESKKERLEQEMEKMEKKRKHKRSGTVSGIFHGASQALSSLVSGGNKKSSPKK